MIIEVNLICAGAVSLMAQSLGAKIDEVDVTGQSVRILLNDELVANRILAEQCKNQGLLYRDW